MKRLTRGVRFAWFVAAGLCLILSGAAGSAIAAAGVEPAPCEAECAGSFGEDSCPAACTAGACAKAPIGVPANVLGGEHPRGVPVIPIVDLSRAVPDAVALDGVFQPPKK